MSVRERVEEALVRELLARQYVGVHFRFGEPVVHWTPDHPDPAVRGTDVADGEKRYRDTVALAERLYQVVINSIDFNRYALEAWSAYDALHGGTDDGGTYRFGQHAPSTGRALRLALLTERTLPDWTEEARNLE